MVESSIMIAFIGASLAWLVVSVAAWYVRRKMRSVRNARTAEKRRLRGFAKPLRLIG